MQTGISRAAKPGTADYRKYLPTCYF